MMMSLYRIAISAVAFWYMIAVITPFAFLLAFMILMWAGGYWWNSALLIADSISWSILFGSGTLSSLLRIRRLSALLEPVVGAEARLAGFFWFRGGTISHRLVSVSADVIAPFGAAVALSVGVSVGVGAGLCACAGFVFEVGLGFGFYFGFGIGIYWSCLPVCICCSCCCWCSSGFSGPPVCVRSACIEASRPTP
jgi:hypothetical protein